MCYMRLLLVCWFLFAISIYHARSQDPTPIMELYAPDVNSVTKISDCKNGLKNDVDSFTVRGKVNRNGANSDVYKDTNLYLQAVADPSTNMWASQCRPDLTVCGSNLNTDCYCESKDSNGDYHIVMTIMAKSIYSGGKLMLSWNDARSPFNPPILSNQVDYYPETIRQPKIATLKIGSFDRTIDTDTSFNTYKDFRLDYTAEMTSATFCVNNLEANSLIEIKENENTPVQTTTDSCVTLDFSDQSPDRVLTMSFTETGGCERTGSYILRISPGSDCGLEAYQIVFIVIIVAIVVILIIIIVIMLCQRHINESSLKYLMLTALVLLVVAWLFITLLILIKLTRNDCGFEGYKIALIVIMSALTLTEGFCLKYIKRKNKEIPERTSEDTMTADNAPPPSDSHRALNQPTARPGENNGNFGSSSCVVPAVGAPPPCSSTAHDRIHDNHMAIYSGKNNGLTLSSFFRGIAMSPAYASLPPHSFSVPNRSHDKHKDNQLGKNNGLPGNLSEKPQVTPLPAWPSDSRDDKHEDNQAFAHLGKNKVFPADSMEREERRNSKDSSVAASDISTHIVADGRSTASNDLDITNDKKKEKSEKNKVNAQDGSHGKQSRREAMNKNNASPRRLPPIPDNESTPTNNSDLV